MNHTYMEMKRRDWILIGAILLVALAAFLAVRLKAKPGGSVIIRVNGEITEEISLSEEGTYSLNGGTNILRIQEKEAWLLEADCPDKLCVRQGKIRRAGEVITCLPNRLTVTVSEAADALDVTT